MSGRDSTKRVAVYIRCSDEANDRLFRRQDGRDGHHENVHARMNEILRTFCDEVDAEHGVRLLGPRADPEKVKSRRFYIEAELKQRIDRLASETPVSSETLYREAIFRRTQAL